MIRYADADKKQHICKAEMHPYFFIKETDLFRSYVFMDPRYVSHERGKFVAITGFRVVKINVRYPSDVRRGRGGLREDLEREGIETFESDIPFAKKRWMIDKGIKQCPITTKAYMDAEMDAREGFPEPETAPFRIISIAVSGNDGARYFFCDDDERKMLVEFLELFRKKYHMFTGWNIKQFDWPYIRNRMKHLKIKSRFLPIQEIDAMQNYRKLTIWGFMGGSYALDAVAKNYLGIDHGKLQTMQDAHDMWNSFAGDRQALKEYNEMDADIVRRLDEKLHLCDPYIELTKMWPLLLRETPFMTSVIDTMLLEEATKHEWRLVFPRKREHEAELLGGMTLDPTPGVHRSVLALDFKSLYPTIMITYGFSPELMYLFQAWRDTAKPLNAWIRELFDINIQDETLPPKVPPKIPMDSRPADKYAFWKAHFLDQVHPYVHFVRVLIGTGVTPYAFYGHHMKELLIKRAEIKTEMKKYPEESIEFMSHNISQAGVKLVLVSSYGVAGYRNTRFFNDEFVNATTGIGQTILELVVQVVDSLGYRVIYGDTDSIFVKSREWRSPFELSLEAPNVAAKITEQLKVMLGFNHGVGNDDYSIDLDAKVVYSSLLFTEAKKKYIGQTVWVEGRYETKREVVGFESKRSDAFGLMVEVQEALADILATSEVEKVRSKIEPYLTQVARDLFDGKHDKKLILKMSIRKANLDSYESEDPHVRVARKLQAKNMFRHGDKVKWVVIGDQDEEPIIDVDLPLPRTPTTRGYSYYFNRLMDMVTRMLGYRPGIHVDGTGAVMKQLTLDTRWEKNQSTLDGTRAN